MKKPLKNKKAAVEISAAVIAVMLISATLVSLGFLLYGDDIKDAISGTPAGGTIDWGAGEPGEVDASGMVSVNRPIKFVLINEFTKAAGASFTCTLYDSSGINVLEPAGTSGTDGNYTTLGYYPSGTNLVLGAVSGENDIRHKVTVPKMTAADVDAITTNMILVSTFTVPGADVTSSATPASTGTALADGGDWNKTVSGNTDTITFNWNLPTDDEGFISSYDEINGMNWNAVLYCKLYGTNYELASLSGWDGQYSKGTAVWYYHVLDDVEVQKDKQGNAYVSNGAGSFSFTLDATGYSGDAADLEISMYVKTDQNYHNLKGSFGPDSYAIQTSDPFTIDLID